MKNKKSFKGDKTASPAGNALNTTSTYSSDRPLFKLLGLMPFSNIPSRKEYFVGEVKFKNGSNVKIWACPAPALFWKFEVFVVESHKTIKISTGSGALENFWNAIKLIAENMLDVENTEFKK